MHALHIYLPPGPVCACAQETRTVTDKFAEEMPKAVVSTCGVQHVVNPYALTRALVARTHAAMFKLEPNLEATMKSHLDSDGRQRLDCPEGFKDKHMRQVLSSH